MPIWKPVADMICDAVRSGGVIVKNSGVNRNKSLKPRDPGVRILTLLVLAAVACLGVMAGWYFITGGDTGLNLPLPPEIIGDSPVEAIPEEERQTPDLILLGARQEAEQGTRYDASYVSIEYPGGDVSSDRGACTDVVIRAFRNAGIDLQQLIHEDMRENFASYPRKWGLTEPDPNIDHRRVPNQIQFFKTYGESLTLEVEGHLEEWKWGDVVYWRFSDGRDHCGIISDRTTRDGIPLVIHNAGLAREEKALLRWEITGHFRYPAKGEV
jgi:uncharacterized protein YijF (DUF1287 family)